MKRALRYGGYGLLGLVALVVVLLAVVYVLSARQLDATFPTDVPVARALTSATALAEGRRQATFRGCQECHGADFGGKVLIDDPALGRIVTANLTPGGRTKDWSDADFTRAIRHGVTPDGHGLLLMPSHEYYPMSDSLVGAIIGYLRSLPPVTRPLPASRVGPVGRALLVSGQAPILPAETIAHGAPRPADVPVGPTAAYGKALALACSGCHGQGFNGGPTPDPNMPAAANLTPAGRLKDWSAADFARALKTGVRPDGSKIDPAMPIAMTAALDTVEVAALYAFFRSLPATPTGE